MAKVTTYVIGLFLIVAFTTCKKYPEAGTTFRVKKKLDGGLNDGHEKQWKVVLFEVNGIDSTKQFKPKKSKDRFSYYDVQISPDRRSEKAFFIKTEVASFKMKLSTGKLTMVISPDEIKYTDAVICYRTNICERNIFMPYASSNLIYNWNIQVLTKDKMTISLEDKNVYRISLEYADAE